MKVADLKFVQYNALIQQKPMISSTVSYWFISLGPLGI